MKNGYNVNVKLSENLLRKLLYGCEAERTKGRIPADKLKSIDISAYTEEE